MAAGVSATAIALGNGFTFEFEADVLGKGFTCAIEAGGKVKCWGYNNFGQLGIGSNEQQSSPVAVPGRRGVWAGRIYLNINRERERP
jgi:alpha-tubulin suppressor-like RCC1 family protein